jgi:hypothetical protein
LISCFFFIFYECGHENFINEVQIPFWLKLNFAARGSGFDKGNKVAESLETHNEGIVPTYMLPLGLNK